MYNILIAKYGEIGVKGKNRYIFENKLIKNVKNILKPIGKFNVYKEYGRIYVDYDYVIPEAEEGEEVIKPDITVKEEDERYNEYLLTDMVKDFTVKYATYKSKDENGNEYVFSCADGNFSYAGNTGEGIWESETQQKQIYVGKNNYPLQLIIKEAGDEGKTLVTGTFVEMVDEHTAKFEIDKEYLSNPIFGDALTEFYITKQIIEQ